MRDPIWREWYEARAGVTQANYGCAVSHEFARAMVIDGSDGADYLIDGPIAALNNPDENGLERDAPDPGTGQRDSRGD